MRLRNIKGSNDIINNSAYIVLKPEKHQRSWNKVFNNKNPIYIEIGMGKGKFILKNALKYPTINFIGIEKYDKVMARTLKRIANYKLSNLKLIRMDALNIDDVFKNEVERIYLNFSDPWTKKKHFKRRLTSNYFLTKYLRIFSHQKEIFLKTDNLNFFVFSLLSLYNYGYEIKIVNKNLKSDITTEYEEKYLKKGLDIYKLKASKK